MEELEGYELRWKTLIQMLIDAREYSLRQDVEIQHIINIMASIERQFPITTPQDVPEGE